MRFKYKSKTIPLLAVTTEQLLEGILEKTDIDGAVVTRTHSTPEEQAAAMYNNLETYGEAAQRRLYKAAGREVISVYVHQKLMGATKAAVLHAMIQKILEAGPRSVSAHCSTKEEWKVRDVFDIAPSSIPKDKKRSFENQVSETPGVAKFLKPPIDPAYHIEIVVPV